VINGTDLPVRRFYTSRKIGVGTAREALGAMRGVARIWLVAAALGCAPPHPSLRCEVDVPPEFGSDFDRVRYSSAYEAFWWNCVGVRSQHPDARCPFVCSGTPSAAAGCRDGATAADRGIDELVRSKWSGAQEYLRSLAAGSEARDKIKPYFGDKAD
jgi:hypothetical protein